MIFDIQHLRVIIGEKFRAFQVLKFLREFPNELR